MEKFDALGFGKAKKRPFHRVPLVADRDVREIGSTSFAIDKRVFKLYDPRPINVSTFYSYRSWRTYFETKFIPKTESIGQISYAQVEPKFNYVFNYY